MAKIKFEKKEAGVVTATKALVDNLLSLNTNNRNVNKNHIRWLRNSIEKNNFVLTGQGISVSKDGELIDGQHRLMALRDAGYPAVELLVVTGLDDKAKIYVDQYKKRSTSAMLKVALNERVTPKMASIVVFRLKTIVSAEGFRRGNDLPPLDKIVKEAKKYGKDIERLIDAGGPLPRTAILAAYLDFSIRYGMPKAIEFAEKVRDGGGKLKDYLMEEGRKVKGGGSAQLYDYAMTVAACKSYASGKWTSELTPATSWED